MTAVRWLYRSAAERRRATRSKEIAMDTLDPRSDGWNDAYTKWAKAEVARRAQAMQDAKDGRVTSVGEIDPSWMKRLLFVMHRRPDAVASR